MMTFIYLYILMDLICKSSDQFTLETGTPINFYLFILFYVGLCQILFEKGLSLKFRILF